MSIETISTVMIPEDFEGSKWNSEDCIGHRSFKRACKENLKWWQRIFIKHNWGDYNSIPYHNLNPSNSIYWESYKNGVSVNMINNVEIGDIITFKRIVNKE